MQKYRYDYYMVGLPGDMFDNYSDYINCAINHAKERARLYAPNAMWLTETKGSLGDANIFIKVTRKRANTLKTSKT